MSGRPNAKSAVSEPDWTSVPQTEFVRLECLAIAQALDRPFTARAVKRSAATLLRNALMRDPHCKFCGAGPRAGVELHQSLDPSTWICTYCAWYVARGREQQESQRQWWARMKDFAP
jgi:hypothetical protein